jgi:hypothetical protein
MPQNSVIAKRTMIEQSSDKLHFRFKDDVARTLPYATLQVGISHGPFGESNGAAGK